MSVWPWLARQCIDLAGPFLVTPYATAADHRSSNAARSPRPEPARLATHALDRQPHPPHRHLLRRRPGPRLTMAPAAQSQHRAESRHLVGGTTVAPGRPRIPQPVSPTDPPLARTCLAWIGRDRPADDLRRTGIHARTPGRLQCPLALAPADPSAFPARSSCLGPWPSSGARTPTSTGRS